MFNFLRLFSKKKSEDLIKAKIDYSSYSSFDIIYEHPDISLKEYFVFSLLIYARMLRFSDTTKHNEMQSSFLEMKENFKKGLLDLNSKNYTVYKEVYIKNYGRKDTSINVNLRKNNTNFYLNSSTPYTKEYQVFVYIAFFHAFEKMKKNQGNLISAFIKLGEINLEKKISIEESVQIPNELEAHFFSLLDYING